MGAEVTQTLNYVTDLENGKVFFTHINENLYKHEVGCYMG